MSTFTSKLRPGEVFHDGMIRMIRCPSGSAGVTAILLQDASGEQIGEFALCDANGDPTASVDNVWTAGRYIQVLFDISSGCAQVLNGANSAAMDNRITKGIDDLESGVTPLADDKIHLVYE